MLADKSMRMTYPRFCHSDCITAGQLALEVTVLSNEEGVMTDGLLPSLLSGKVPLVEEEEEEIRFRAEMQRDRNRD